MTSAAFSSSRVARALASSVLSQAITVGQTYLLVPLFLAAWGGDGYGRWLSLTALASYLQLVDLGGQTYVGNRLAAAFAKNESAEFRLILRRGFSVFLAVTLVAWSLVVLAALLLPNTGWDLDSKLVVVIYSTFIAIGVPGGVLVSCYAATGRVVRGANVGNLVRIVTLGLCVTALALHATQPVYAGVQLVYGMLATTAIVVDLRRQIPELFPPRASWQAVGEAMPLLRESLPYWIFGLAGALSLQGVLLVVSANASDATVAAYATHRSAASLILYAGALLRPALWTELTFLAARKDYPRIRELVSIAVRSSTWFAAVVGSAICLAAPFGYALWTRSKLELHVPLLVLLAVQATLSAAWSAAAWPLMSASQPRSLARWTLLNAVLTVAGGYVCMRLGTGLIGLVAWSLAVDVVCGLIPFPLAAFAFMQGSARSFFWDIARAALCAAPFGLLAYLCLVSTADNRLRLVGFGVGGLLLAWPSLRFLYGRDFERIQRSLRRALGGASAA